MSTVQIRTEISLDELLRGVEQLSLPDLEQFVDQVIALQARRRSPGLPKDEAKLLLRINQGLPLEAQRRYNELVAKRKAETLSPNEHRELLHLVDRIEKLDAKRAEYLAELAKLRGTSLTALMKELGIRPPAYA